MPSALWTICQHSTVLQVSCKDYSHEDTVCHWAMLKSLLVPRWCSANINWSLNRNYPITFQIISFLTIGIRFCFFPRRAVWFLRSNIYLSWSGISNKNSIYSLLFKQPDEKWFIDSPPKERVQIVKLPIEGKTVAVNWIYKF